MANVEVKGYSAKASTTPKKYNIYINLFFDGTKNNKNNTNARSSNHAQHGNYKKYGAKDDESSYQNDWSNVARLWENSSNSNSIYVEGIGTEDYKKDSTMGYAFGSGSTGVRFKVRKGCENSADLIKRIMDANKEKILAEVIFNVFGFSRGAAAARNFVSELSRSNYKARSLNHDGYEIFYDIDSMPAEEKMPQGGHFGYMMQKKGVNVKDFIYRVNFLGVFDTVASYSPVPLPRFSDDINELGLNKLAKATHVVHLTAIDEMRENFSLSRTTRGIERNLPGVHSDIGGSYLSGEEKKEEIETSWTTKSRLYPFRDRLIEEGWYKPGELTITGGFAYFALKGVKTMVYKEYSYIPLHFMGEYCQRSEGMVSLKKLETTYSIEKFELLVRAKNKLKDYVLGTGKPNPYCTNHISSENLKDLKDLRHDFFHRSARREGIGMDPNNNWKRVELVDKDIKKENRVVPQCQC